MATEKPEQDGFLAVIERKIDALKALADSYRTALSLGALGQPGDIDISTLGSATGRPDGPIDLPQGALLGKSLPGAVKLWLTASRRKQTVREIATALKEGGVESTSPNFENVVTGALHRLKANGEVLRFKDGWALAELYPATLRSNRAKETKPARAVRHAKKKTTTARKKQSKVVRAKASVSKLGPTIDERIVAFLKAHPGQRFGTKQAGEAVKESDPKLVGMAFARLVRFGKVSKGDDGLYTASRAAEHLKAV